MGRRDYRKPEKKKPKKDIIKKALIPNVTPTPISVEVVKRGKKEPEPEE